jgi:hypothetical protein
MGLYALTGRPPRGSNGIPTRSSKKRRFTMAIGGGILGTILMVLLIVYLWRSV